ncbi:class I SAM-dependent methyltransferase [bacterium]|nr:class I SAM-dependent methyltransferase [bacterium]
MTGSQVAEERSAPIATAPNIDPKTVEGFGDEWDLFDQTALTEQERADQFDAYFENFPWKSLPTGAVGFDLGCGSGRWAKMVAPRVGTLWCIDASPVALESAKRNLYGLDNCEFAHASVDAIPLPDDSMDFGYSLGVLHHIPDTAAGLKSCVRKLKPGAPFALYIYYAFDNRPSWFRPLWQVSDLLRRMICRMPNRWRHVATDPIAVAVYWPLARTAAWLERRGLDVDAFPLAGYRHRAFYSMRTDALDRLGTRLEQRFTREQIRQMMDDAGLERIRFASGIPYWCAMGYRK